jgi:hypothetical protein
MYLNDRLLTLWVYAVGLGLSLLGMAAYVLDWPLAIQLASPWLLIVVLRGTALTVRHVRRRR